MDNFCAKCNCYDSDLGCTMSSIDKPYACPIESVGETPCTFCNEYYCTGCPFNKDGDE